MIKQGTNPHERAFRRSDLGALLTVLFGALFFLNGTSLEMTRETGPAMYALSAFCFAIVVVLPILVRGVWRKAPPGEDEYLRKLTGISSACGFYFAFAVFVVWTPLSGTLLPDLAGPQVLGLMLLGAGLGWFAMRWRDAR